MADPWSILVLEDDVWIQELIHTLLEATYPRARILMAGYLEQAEIYWNSHQPVLAIVDWNLPDGYGTQLIRTIRKTDRDTPVIMLTGRSDRESVSKAARLGIQGFIAKPFDIEILKDRLESILPPPEESAVASESGSDLEVMLNEAWEHGVRLPGGMDPVELSELLNKAESLSINDLAVRWGGHAQLVAVLLNAANSASLRRSGQACSTLREALAVLGVQISLGHASALALDVRGALRDSRLLACADELLQRSADVGAWASRLARTVRGKTALCFTAGQLYCLGEFAVLSVCQRFLDAGGELVDGRLESVLSEWSPALGNRLKADWRLPLELRDMIGATHVLSGGHQPAGRLVMRSALLLGTGQQDQPELDKLLGRLGIDKDALLAAAQTG
ncbi:MULTISPECIES: response regulator [Halomonadaceae]|jgi:DNA-binding response OmpR family regulator|uniref:Response regulator n=1 Tax=Vreelandella halophila TaxID=86177 RepID=A0A9X5B6V7_9GAMM|nr:MULTISPECIES: response regulator [Halomonas]MYL27883.1 response regulator [Halomonas utahensis]MYL75009.1 response regulator [Halomonas sp. 22501_18_FS]